MKKAVRASMRFVSVVLAALLCVMLFTSAAEPEGESAGSKLILGEYLRMTCIAGNAEALIDDSGMSGIESSLHLCGTDTRDMFVFDNNGTVVFMLSRAESLGQFYIWNYNDPSDLASGVKELNVQYSLDGANWTALGNFTLNMSSGDEDQKYSGCVAANYDDPINFNGVPAKYIALTPVSNHGGSKTGLSEIRVFRHKIRPDVGDMVTGEVINITAGVTPEAALNNQGMSDLTSASATHNNVPSDMWLSNEDISASYYTVNMDGTYPISSVTIWNYNDPANLGAGVKDFKIYYTRELPCAINNKTNSEGKVESQTFDFSKGSWTALEINGQNTFTLPQGDGSDKLSGFTLTFDEVIEAQHIKIVPVSTYGGSGVGLSEVRFFAGKGWGIEPARLWTGLLSTSGSFPYSGTAYGTDDRGWIYADGVYSYHMTGAQKQGSLTEDSVIFITFEDTAYGNMYNYKNWNSRTGYRSARHSGWVNMSYLVIKGNKPDVRNAQFILQGKDSDIHPLHDIMGKVYWTGDFTWIDDDEGGGLYVHAPDVSDQSSGVPVDMVKIYFNDDMTPNMDIVPKVINNDKAGEFVPSFADGTIYENTVAAGAPNPDGYIYIFTEKSGGLLRVARCLPSDFASGFDNYEFWGGEEKGWVKGDESVTKTRKANVSSYDPGGEAAIAYMFDGAFAGKYVNIYTEGSIGGQLKMGVSDSLTGMFTGPAQGESKVSNPLSLMWGTEQYKLTLYRGYDGVSQWNYNAKSHPAISAEGELLISYHIGAQNAIDSMTAYEYTHPVFYNMFSVGEFASAGGGINGLLIALIAGGAALVAAAVVVVVMTVKKKKAS